MTAEPSAEFTYEPTTTRIYEVRYRFYPVTEDDSPSEFRAMCREAARREITDNLPGARIVDGPREERRYPVNCPSYLQGYSPEEIERLVRHGTMGTDHSIDLDVWWVVYRATVQVPVSLLSPPELRAGPSVRGVPGPRRSWRST